MRRLGLVLAFAAGCGAPIDDDFGIDEVLRPNEPSGGKEDNAGIAGPLIATNTSATQVWTASNKWEDRTTTEAKKAGLAWGVDSGLNWDEKYSKWVDSLEIYDGEDGYHTMKISTPWGKTVEAPVLECAETALFLRATFAAWYKLPFFLESVSSSGRVYFGHFGIRQGSVKYANTPNFATSYKDHSTTWTAGAAWPKDTALRARAAAGGEDTQVFPAGEHFGAYLDEVHLNKRAGHLIIYLLNYLGSANLADSRNTFNLKPDAIKSGDLLLHRWQKTGIGDAKIIKTVGRNASGTMTAQLISGSMPRRQPKLYDEIASKGYFTSEDTGGEGVSGDGVPYWKLGGGVKRFRVTKNVGGYWTNTWMSADEASWINSTDEAKITARPTTFETLLGEVSPTEKRDGLLRQIADARAHLMKYPASCAARERRERAFRDLYDLAPRLGTTASALDRQHRTLADYVFGELEYTKSKTCCWNSSTAAMAEIIMDFAEEEQAQPMCATPTVFKAMGGGYPLWADFAARTGRAAAWRAWSEDETCLQRDVSDDTARAGEALPWCSVEGGSSCGDSFEPNDNAPRAINAGTLSAQICDGDVDFYSVTVAAGGRINATINFRGADGDLDFELLSPSGTRIMISESTSDRETVTGSNLAAGVYKLRVFGYDGATNPYTLTLSL